jgi:hypothetical protein
MVGDAPVKLVLVEPGASKHPRINVIDCFGRSKDGKTLAVVRCNDNVPLVDYTATGLDGPKFNELTRAIRDALWQIRQQPCATCGRH